MSEKKEKTSAASQVDVLPSFEEPKNEKQAATKSLPGKVKKAAASKDGKRPSIKGSLSRKIEQIKQDHAAQAENGVASKKTDHKEPKKKKSEKLVKEGLALSEHNEHAKLIFILSMILLTPIAVVVALCVIALFVAAFALTLLLAGVMGLALIAVVGAGVVLSFVGSAYGLISILTAEGFALVAGQYELGLSLAIAGITIIASALLYSGMTDLVPYIVKKLGQFFVYLFKKVKKLIIWLYKYSTQL